MSFLVWYWPLALAFIAFVLFGIPEFCAIKYGGETFSRFMATVANAGAFGKIWVLLWGLLIGGLAVHFNGWCVDLGNPKSGQLIFQHIGTTTVNTDPGMITVNTDPSPRRTLLYPID